MAKNKTPESTTRTKTVTYYQIEFYVGHWYNLDSLYLGVKGFDEYSSDGECYAQTKEIGVFDKEYALAYMHALKKACLECKLFSVGYSHTMIEGFRVIEVTKTINKEVIESWLD